MTEDALTFPDGMRVARYTQRPVSDAEYYERVGDILALTRFASVTADGSHGTAFRRTLEQSATVAVAESTGAGQSTTTLLAETPLVDWAQVDVGAWEADGVDYDRWDEFVGTTGYWGPEGMGRYKRMLVPEDGSVRAYWSLDRQTGSVLGVLPDGTNGAFGAEPTEAILMRLSRVVTMLNLLCAASGAGGLSMASLPTSCWGGRSEDGDGPAEHDDGEQEAADAPGERGQRELDVVLLEHREGVDGEGIGEPGDTERERQARVAVLPGEFDRLFLRPRDDVEARTPQEPYHRAGLLCLLAEGEREDAAGGLAGPRDEHDEREFRLVRESQFQRREQHHLAR